jgi:hypothetical protein
MLLLARINYLSLFTLNPNLAKPQKKMIGTGKRSGGATFGCRSDKKHKE